MSRVNGALIRPGSIPLDRLDESLPSGNQVGNQGMTTAAVSSDYTTTGLTISATPVNGSYVQVFIQGVMRNLKGDRTGDCYFSDDSGANAKALNAVVAGDTLYWNAVISGVTLAGTERVDFVYPIA